MYGLTEAFRSTYLDPGRGRPAPRLDRQGDPERRDPGRPAGRDALRPGRGGRAGPPRRPGRARATGTTRSAPPSGSARRPGARPSWRTPELAVWSGDTVVADEEGFLYFVGRKDEMIKTSGLPGQPDRDRGGRLRHRLVRDAVALGVEDDRLGQRSCCSSTAAGRRARPDALIAAHAAASCRCTWCPPRSTCATQLPRSPNGKFDRTLLKPELA